MRIWGVVLVLAAIIGIGIVGSMMADRVQPQRAAIVMRADLHAPLYHRPSRFGDAWHRHRSQFQRVAEYSQQARTERAVAVVCFFVFVLITVPKNARGIKAFYRQLVDTHPLPPEAGDNDESNRRARKVLFFYLLFLLYQIVQFPLTWGRDNTVQFTSDLVFQFVLMVGVLVTYAGLRKSMAHQVGGKPSAVLTAKLDGIPIRWRDMPRLAALMFVGGFAPALFTKLPGWFDVLTA